MKRPLLEAKRGGGFNKDNDGLSPTYLSVLGYPHHAQQGQEEEPLPVPLPMFKRLRITSGGTCSPHDCTSTTADNVANTEMEQGLPSLLHSQPQQHQEQHRFPKPPQIFSDRWLPEAGLTTTTPTVVDGGIQSPSLYSNMNQLLGNLHRERKSNRPHLQSSSAYESDEGGRTTTDYLQCLLYTNKNQEHSDANSTSSLSSCTTTQPATAGTYHHALVVENTPRSYRTKLYTDSRLF